MRRTHSVPAGPTFGAGPGWPVIVAVLCMLFVATPALAALQAIVEETGGIYVSVDGEGNNDVEGGFLLVDKPIDATVRSAHLFAAGFPYRNIFDGDVQLLGVPVDWDIDFTSYSGDWTFNNVYADVTDIVQPNIDDSPAGLISVAVTETDTENVDGTILVVIFDDPNQASERSVILLFGGQSADGDTFVVNLSSSIDLSSSDVVADMGLGISFGCQGGGCYGGPFAQYSEVDVNGQPLTCFAGGADDASSGGDDGTLITVGGIGDSNANPDPACPPLEERVADDELYNLLPFVNDGDTSITVHTVNPSGDDNIFFSYVVTPPASVLCGDGVVGPGESCDDGNALDGDCCSSSCQLEPAGTVCRDESGLCDVAETCDGVSGFCPADGFEASGIVCRPGRAICDTTETCTGTSPTCPVNQLEPAGTVCRPAAGDCDVAEACNGDDALCPADDFEAFGTVCRASAGVCDVAETCSGEEASCPTDGFADSGTVCRGSAGVCDVVETCSGSTAACPTNGFVPSGVICRGAEGACDVAEACTGAAAACPADGFAGAGSVCRPAAGTCDVAEVCAGSVPSCPADGFVAAGTVCRESAGVCDLAESCSGSTAACPGDSFVLAGTVCRGAAGPCDLAEACSGNTAACPVDGFVAAGTVCRGAEGLCDVAETCSGSSIACPADGVATAGTVCRGAEGLCDVAEACSGITVVCPPDGFAAAGTVCRTAEGVCDVAESCSGSSPFCEEDLVAEDGTPCPDTRFCNGLEVCSDGRCVDGPDPVQAGKVCREDPILSEASQPLPDWAEAIELRGTGPNALAVLALQERGLHIYDVSDRSNPVLVGSYLPTRTVCPGNDFFFDEVAIDGNQAFVAAGICGLLILDISEPESPTLIQRFDTPGWAKGVKVQEVPDGLVAYVADYGGGLRIIDVTQPPAPQELAALGSAQGLLGAALSVHARDDLEGILLYVATTEGFFVVDVSFPAFPVVMNFIDTNPSGLPLADLEEVPQDVLVVGDRAYVPIWLGGLLVLDLDDPFDPFVLQQIDSIAPGSQAFFKVAAAGSNVYVTEGQCGLRVFGTTEGGLAEVFFESVANPIKVGGGTADCTQNSNDPWAWDLAQSRGVVWVTNGVQGSPERGGFESIDFSTDSRSGVGPGCGLGVELALMLPLLAGLHRRRGRLRRL